MRFQATLGALFAGSAVMLGAFGTHALRNQLSVERLATYRTGVEYQLWHGIALLLLAALHDRLDCDRRTRATGWLFVVGTALFSGSLYALAFGDWASATMAVPAVAMLTPLGGACLIAGWLSFAWNAFRAKAPDSESA
ncbi:MAG: DUF423 domain-containing protein [Fimbriimonadaceae bacterium]|nr:DUF423 domain-containing protein [Fimbriimonadaceae bacterium]